MTARLGFGLAPVIGYVAGIAVAVPIFAFCVYKGVKARKNI